MGSAGYTTRRRSDLKEGRPGGPRTEDGFERLRRFATGMEKWPVYPQEES